MPINLYWASFCRKKNDRLSSLDWRNLMSEENKDVTITDINISMGTVFRLVLQFIIASAVIGGVIGFIFLLFTEAI